MTEKRTDEQVEDLAALIVRNEKQVAKDIHRYVEIFQGRRMGDTVVQAAMVAGIVAAFVMQDYTDKQAAEFAKDLSWVLEQVAAKYRLKPLLKPGTMQ